MVIEGEARDKLYSIIADAVDVIRLYKDAVRLVEAYKSENEELLYDVDRLGGEARALQAQIAALEHTVSELQERNDRLRLKLDVANRSDGKWRKAFEIACQTIRGAVGIPDLMNYLKARLCHAGVDVEIPGREHRVCRRGAVRRDRSSAKK